MNTTPTPLLPTPPRHRITVDVDAAMWEKLKTQAAAEERTASSVVRLVLRRWVNDQDQAA